MPEQSKQKRTVGSNIWIWLCIGLALTLILPELDYSNDEPIYISAQSYETDDGYSHIVKIHHKNQSRLTFYLNPYDVSRYKSYVEVYFNTSNKSQFFSKMHNISEDLWDLSRNIKYVKHEQFKELVYE